MRKKTALKILTIGLVLTTGIALIRCADRATKPEMLFTEEAEDWLAMGDADWTFEGDELVGVVEEGSGFVMTKKTYKDFVLELEFKPDSTVNSGVFVRCKQRELSHTDCYEMNIWDLHPNQDFRTGAIVSRSVPEALVYTNDKWNTYKIRCEKGHLQVWINDILTADIQNDDLDEGYISLQAAESGEVRFRKLSLTPLK